MGNVKQQAAEGGFWIDGKPDIPPHPAGQHAMRCIDIIDRGVIEGQFGKKRKVTLRFFGGEYVTDDKGDRIPLWIDKWFTVSIHPKSVLRSFLKAWRGRDFTDDEVKRFNLETVYGALALIQSSINDKGYADIDSIMKLPKGSEAPPALTNYVRVKDRDDTNERDPGADDEDDDSMPF